MELQIKKINSNTIYGNCKELKIYDLTGTLADDLLDSTIIELKILY